MDAFETKELLEQWKRAYFELDPEKDASVVDLDLESVCFGFCLAKGLTLDDARRFYRGICIPAGVF